jgi:hypothetical protein
MTLHRPPRSFAVRPVLPGLLLGIAMAVGAGCGSSSTAPPAPPAPKFGCRDAVTCQQTCLDQACVDACVTKINTVTGHALYAAALSCVTTACPITGGGVCDAASGSYSASQCQSCVNAASLGACATALSACGAD